MLRDPWYWRRAQSHPPPGCLWRLWRSASTLTEPFRLDGNVLCWCGGGGGALEDNNVRGMDWAMESMYLRVSGVDIYLIIQNAQSIFPSSWSHAHLLSFYKSTPIVWFVTHSCQAFIDPCNLCGSSLPRTPSYALTLFLHWVSQNCSVSWSPFGRREGSPVSAHHHCVTLEMYFWAVKEQVWTWT